VEEAPELVAGVKQHTELPWPSGETHRPASKRKTPLAGISSALSRALFLAVNNEESKPELRVVGRNAADQFCSPAFSSRPGHARDAGKARSTDQALA
jgi:hypothetical protein